jgi:hypothetical protein
MTVRLGHDIRDMTSAMTLDMTGQTGQSGQVSLTGHPGQVRQDRRERTGCQDIDSKDRTVGKGKLGTRAME